MWVLFNLKIAFVQNKLEQQHPSHFCKSSQPFPLIHNDIWGPACSLILSQTRWLVTFIDDHTRICWVYLMIGKSQTFQIFQQFHRFIKDIFQTSIQIFRTGNGREYFSIEFQTYLTHHGFFTKVLVPTPLNKIGLLREKRDTF